MNYQNAAIFSDLDGTLLNTDHQVSAGNLAAIRRFTEAGGLFAIATGRPPVNARRVLADVPLNGWCVVMNGTMAYHYERNESFGAVEIPQKELSSLFAWVMEREPRVNVQICTADDLLFISDPAYEIRDFVDTHQPMRVTDLADSLKDPWLKALLCAPHELLEPVYAEAERRGLLEKVDLVYSADYYLEFLAKGVNKGRCLRMVREMPELSGRTIIAIGDYYNDLEVFREADIAVAVGNALPEVKAAAQYEAAHHNEDALADLIDRLIPSM